MSLAHHSHRPQVERFGVGPRQNLLDNRSLATAMSGSSDDIRTRAQVGLKTRLRLSIDGEKAPGKLYLILMSMASPVLNTVE